MELILGTMTFGESVFSPDVKDFINTFLDAGYLEMDTAYVYNEGQSEKLLGEVLPCIEKPYKIATKVNPRISGKLDADAAYMQVNESLKRLKVSCIETLYLHFPDPATPVEGVLEACENLYEQGKFKELGLSNFPAWMVSDAWHKCDKNGWIKPTVYEGIYNPLTRKVETELNACLDNFGMRFCAYNPLAGGLLSGKYNNYMDSPSDGRFTHRPNYQKRYWKKCYFDAVDLIKKSCGMHDITIIEATYRWMAYHSMLNGERGDAVIIGASKLNHLKQNISAMDAGELPTDVENAFEEAWSICKADSPEYFTLYNGLGSVGGIK
ncbi:MAG: aldo/keto reductase [Butyrivibrio sp.]|nr:aldo/keto reductase [Butyrivibrio sp.]